MDLNDVLSSGNLFSWKLHRNYDMNQNVGNMNMHLCCSQLSQESQMLNPRWLSSITAHKNSQNAIF